MLLGASRSLRLSPSLRAFAPSQLPRGICSRISRSPTQRRNAPWPIASSPTTTTDDRRGDVSTSTRSDAAPDPPKDWRLKLLHDSDCPLCEREVNMLRRRDSERQNAILFVDVADPGYDPSSHGGIDYETAMRTIHGIVRERGDDGEEKEVVLTGVDVFRRAYDLVGLGFVYAFLDVPILKRIASAAYDAWARIRLPLTGRPTLEVVLAEKKTCRRSPAESE